MIPAFVERAMLLLVADHDTRQAMLGDWAEAYEHERLLHGTTAAARLVWRDFSVSLPHLAWALVFPLRSCRVVAVGGYLAVAALCAFTLLIRRHV